MFLISVVKFVNNKKFVDQKKCNSHPIFWLKESLLLPPRIPRGFHEARTVRVWKRIFHILLLTCWRRYIVNCRFFHFFLFFFFLGALSVSNICCNIGSLLPHSLSWGPRSAAFLASASVCPTWLVFWLLFPVVWRSWADPRCRFQLSPSFHRPSFTVSLTA